MVKWAHVVTQTDHAVFHGNVHAYVDARISLGYVLVRADSNPSGCPVTRTAFLFVGSAGLTKLPVHLH